MKKKIISLWKNLLILFKILLVLWTLYSLTALLVLNVFQWIVIWFFGSFLFIYFPNEILNSIKKKITSRHKHTDKSSDNMYSEIDMNCLESQTKEKINIELFARECNAYIEHMEEMQEYMRYYNIQNSDNSDSND